MNTIFLLGNLKICSEGPKNPNDIVAKKKLSVIYSLLGTFFKIIGKTTLLIT